MMIKNEKDVVTEVKEKVMSHFWNGGLEIDFEEYLEIGNLNRIIEMVSFVIEDYNIDEHLRKTIGMKLSKYNLDVERKLMINKISLEIYYEIKKMVEYRV